MINQRLFLNTSSRFQRALGYLTRVFIVFSKIGFEAARSYSLFLYYFKSKRKQQAKTYYEHFFSHAAQSNVLYKKVFNSLNVECVADLTEIVDSVGTKNLIDENKENIFPFDDLYLYFINYGNLEVAAQLRELATYEATKYTGTSKVNVVKKINSLIEQGNNSCVAQEIKKNKHGFKDSEITFYNDFLKILSKEGNLKTVTPKDREFLKYVENKSIAIVGPSTPINQVGHEIDSFDIIVRPNYLVGQTMDPIYFGARTDISYYNSNAFANRKTQIQAVIDEGRITWLILKSDNWNSHLNIKDSAIKIRTQLAGKALCFHGYFMKIPGIILDLLFFKPNRIKVFNTDFYSGKEDYNKYYKAPLSLQLQSWSLRQHDAFTQFLFCKKLFLEGLVEFDTLGQTALSLSLKDYGEILNFKYGGQF